MGVILVLLGYALRTVKVLGQSDVKPHVRCANLQKNYSLSNLSTGRFGLKLSSMPGSELYFYGSMSKQ